MPVSSYLYGREQYQVVVPLVIVDAPGVTDRHFYQDAILPKEIGDLDIARLLEQGAIRKLEAAK